MDSKHSRRSGRGSLLLAIHITGLWIVLVAHPLLDVVGRAPDVLVAHRADPIDILAILAALMAVPPLILASLVAIAGRIAPRAQAVAGGVILAGLMAAPVAQALVKSGAATWIGGWLPAAAAGGAAAILYFRCAPVRSVITMVSAASFLVPIVFVTRPGIGDLLRPAAFPAGTHAGTSERSSLPVVLIVFDEMPLVSLLDAARRIDARRLPHLAALARDGVWFRNATTVSDYTPWAVPAILTGRFPTPGKAPTFGSYPDTLFTHLSRTHRLEVVESLTRLCPRELCPQAEPSFSERWLALGRDAVTVAGHLFLTPDLRTRLHMPDLSARWAPFARAPAPQGTGAPRDRRRRRNADRDRRELIDDFIRRLGAGGDRPVFYFLHPPLPHEPWILLPTGQKNATRAPLPSAVYASAPIDEWEVVQNQQRHLLQVGYIDHALGRIVDRLKATGLYDRALVILTADHGIAIARGRHARNFAPETAGEIVRVPLIVKFPSGLELPPHLANAPQEERVTDRNVETIDIAPTIAGVLGRPLPWTADGSSLLDPGPVRPEKKIWFDRARSVQRYGADGPSMEAALRERLQTFGEGNVYSIPKIPGLAHLLGRRVGELPISANHVDGALSFGERFAAFSRDGDEVPFDVAGVLREGGEPSSMPADVAVAVNGVIEAVTRTWTTKPGWLATPPLDVWRSGANSVGVYLVEERDGRAALTPVRTAAPADLNLISGEAARYWRVRQHGFYRHEGGGGGFRWTRDAAVVVSPVEGRKPTGIRLSIARGIQPSTRLVVAVNDCRLYEGTVPRGWEVTLPLGDCLVEKDELTIQLTSTAIRPAGDRRLLGVAVREISLIAPAEPPR